MFIENSQEVQRSVKNYYITLLSEEIISIPHITEEDINEDRENYITIDLKTATYNQRLYEAFKNKELVQCIVKHSTNTNIENRENIDRTFTYDKYFKIQTFVTCYGINSPSSYAITFQTV